MSSNPGAFVELPRGTVADFLRLVRSESEGGAERLRAIGAKAAVNLGSVLKDRLGADPADFPIDEFWGEIDRMFESLGWGSLRHEDLHPGVVSLVSSDWFEAEQHDHPHPCCHFSTGLLASLLQSLAGAEIAAMEVECRGAGAAECRFLLGSPDALDELYEVLAQGGSFNDAITALA